MGQSVLPLCLKSGWVWVEYRIPGLIARTRFNRLQCRGAFVGGRLAGGADQER